MTNIDTQETDYSV